MHKIKIKHTFSKNWSIRFTCVKKKGAQKARCGRYFVPSRLSAPDKNKTNKQRQQTYIRNGWKQYSLLKLQIRFSTSNPHRRRLNMAALMPLPTEAITEAKTNTCKDRHGPSSTNEDHTLFQKVWIHASRHIIINTNSEEETGRSRMGSSHWVTNIGYSPVSFHLSLHSGCCHVVSNQYQIFDATRFALLVIQDTFSKKREKQTNINPVVLVVNIL